MRPEEALSCSGRHGSGEGHSGDRAEAVKQRRFRASGEGVALIRLCRCEVGMNGRR